MKTCKVCKTKFNPSYTSMQKVCSQVCALALSRQERSKAERKRLKERKEKLKTLTNIIAELQPIFNEFIRLRDKDEPCISCQRFHQGQIHAGHYLTRGARPNLRFDENNVHAQCSACNNHLSGNLINYRINLINKIGLEEVERLENDHEPRHYTKKDIAEMKAHYRKLIRELKKDAA
uniref:recombination protein NinG n=1 Tax=Ningiella ruwaisensis TaxID=2364274 RepID=UPI003BA9729B